MLGSAGNGTQDLPYTQASNHQTTPQPREWHPKLDQGLRPSQSGSLWESRKRWQSGTGGPASSAVILLLTTEVTKSIFTDSKGLETSQPPGAKVVPHYGMEGSEQPHHQGTLRAPSSRRGNTSECPLRANAEMAGLPEAPVGQVTQVTSALSLATDCQSSRLRVAFWGGLRRLSRDWSTVS